MSAPVVVGVDGGGTKTDVVVADLDGRELAVATGGGANHEAIGTTRMAAQWSGASKVRSLYDQDLRVLRAVHRGAR